MSDQNKLVLQERTMMLGLLALGVRPPGIELLVPWPWLVSILKVYCHVGFFSAFSNLSLMVHFVLTHTVPVIFFLGMIRTIIAYIFCSSRVFHIFYHRPLFETIFHDWDNLLATKFFAAKRNGIFRGELRKTRRFVYFALLGCFVYPQTHYTRYWFKRNTKGASLAGYPHDINSPYHYYYVFYNSFICLYSIANLVGVDILLLYVFTMVSSQLRFLRETLADILEAAPNLGEGSHQTPVADGVTKRPASSAQVKRALRIWISTHYVTLKWIGTVQKFAKVAISLKFLFLAFYSCLTAYSIPALLKVDKSTMAFLMIYVLTSLLLHYYGSKLADDIQVHSSSMFNEAFEKEWYIYPPDIKRSLSIICVYCKRRPVVFKALKLYDDSCASFLQIILVAYRILTFLLQLTPPE